MRKVLGQQESPDGKFRITLFDDRSIRRDRLCTGKIINIDIDAPQTDEEGKVYFVSKVEADVNGKKHVGSAIIFNHQLYDSSLPKSSFCEGTLVGLAIEIRSENAGCARIELLSENKTKQLEDTSSLFGGTPIDYALKIKGVNLRPQKLNDKTSEITNIKDKILKTETLNDSNTGIKKEKEHGCGATFFIMILSFCIVGLILSPLSFLGFLLYPLLVGGGLLLGGFIMNITK